MAVGSWLLAPAFSSQPLAFGACFLTLAVLRASVVGFCLFRSRRCCAITAILAITFVSFVVSLGFSDHPMSRSPDQPIFLRPSAWD